MSLLAFFKLIHVDHSLYIFINGISGDLVHLSSIGRLGVAENKKISAAIGEFLEGSLGVPSNRAYILFRDLPASECGWSGDTFA